MIDLYHSRTCSWAREQISTKTKAREARAVMGPTCHHQQAAAAAAVVGSLASLHAGQWCPSFPPALAPRQQPHAIPSYPNECFSLAGACDILLHPINRSHSALCCVAHIQPPPNRFPTINRRGGWVVLIILLIIHRLAASRREALIASWTAATHQQPEQQDATRIDRLID